MLFKATKKELAKKKFAEFELIDAFFRTKSLFVFARNASTSDQCTIFGVMKLELRGKSYTGRATYGETPAGWDNGRRPTVRGYAADYLLGVAPAIRHVAESRMIDNHM